MRSSTAQFSIIPGREAEAEAAIKKVVAEVEAKEPGCLYYRWHRSLKDPLQIIVWEIFQDDGAIEAHRGMPHMKEFSSLFGAIFDPASVKIIRYEKIAAVER